MPMNSNLDEPEERWCGRGFPHSAHTARRILSGYFFAHDERGPVSSARQKEKARRSVVLFRPARFKFTTLIQILLSALHVARMAELADATDSKSVAL